ncbi:hypothetical protein DXG01_009992, partial [Tephrocybe rancida]
MSTIVDWLYPERVDKALCDLIGVKELGRDRQREFEQRKCAIRKVQDKLSTMEFAHVQAEKAQLGTVSNPPDIQHKFGLGPLVAVPEDPGLESTDILLECPLMLGIMYNSDGYPRLPQDIPAQQKDRAALAREFMNKQYSIASGGKASRVHVTKVCKRPEDFIEAAGHPLAALDHVSRGPGLFQVLNNTWVLLRQTNSSPPKLNLLSFDVASVAGNADTEADPMMAPQATASLPTRNGPGESHLLGTNTMTGSPAHSVESLTSAADPMPADSGIQCSEALVLAAKSTAMTGETDINSQEHSLPQDLASVPDSDAGPRPQGHKYELARLAVSAMNAFGNHNGGSSQPSSTRHTKRQELFKKTRAAAAAAVIDRTKGLDDAPHRA